MNYSKSMTIIVVVPVVAVNIKPVVEIPVPVQGRQSHVTN